MELFLLYLWLKVDTIITAVASAGIISSFAFFFTLMWASCAGSWEDNYQAAVKFKTKGWKRWVFVPISCFMLATFLPSKTDIAILVGGSYALDVAKSPEAAKLMTVIRGKANEILDQQIKQLQTQPKKD